MLFTFPTVGLLILIPWLIILSLLVWKSYNRYSTILHNTKEQTLAAALNKIVKEHEIMITNIDLLFTKTNLLEEHALKYIKKVGLVRFNPFQDTGGDQSFILSLLDNNDTGVVISGLYARSGMRWYVKRIIKGKGIDHELSAEEQKSVDTAK